jgi:hypothetical protein
MQAHVLFHWLKPHFKPLKIAHSFQIQTFVYHLPLITAEALLKSTSLKTTIPQEMLRTPTFPQDNKDKSLPQYSMSSNQLQLAILAEPAASSPKEEGEDPPFPPFTTHFMESGC